MRGKTINQQAVAAFRRRKSLRVEVKSLGGALTRMEKRLEKKREALDLAERTTRIVNKLALRIDGPDIEAIDEELCPRFTQSYTNVRDGGTGLYFREWRPEGGFDDVAIIMSQPLAEAKERALTWVAYGRLPTDEPSLITHHRWPS